MSKQQEIIFDFPADTQNTMSGMRHHLVLDPEARRVWVFSDVGGGTPMAVWHGRACMIRVPETSEKHLRAALEDCRDQIEALFACYLGSDWDGNNWRGKWARAEDGDLGPAGIIEEKIEQYLNDNCPTYCDAGEWLLYDVAETRRQIRHAIAEGCSMADLAAKIVGEADTLLNEREVCAVLEQEIAEMADEPLAEND